MYKPTLAYVTSILKHHSAIMVGFFLFRMNYKIENAGLFKL